MGDVLIVDDEAGFRAMLEAAVRSAGFAARTAGSGEAALREMECYLPDLVLLDQRMGARAMSGVETLRVIRERFGDVPVVMVTAYGDVPTAVAAMKAGALDFMEKPLDLKDLRRILKDVLQAGREDGDEESATGGETLSFGGIVPASDSLRAVVDLLAAAAQSDAPILVAGESGTGKEVAAAFVHDRSPRRHGPFVQVNCAAIPATLLEAEMFGCQAGAFTGATKSREGLFVAAHGGTLLLDEIAEMDTALQVKLLRVLQDKVVQPLGSTRSRTVDVRIVASTNRSIPEAIARGAFREDLYFRLNVFEVVLPPLRERPLDVLPLARRFLSELGGERPLRMAPETEALLCAHDWPGNIRELRNTMERASILARGGVIHPQHLPPTLRAQEGRPAAVAAVLPRAGTSVHEMERALIVETLAATEGNRTRAAEVLGMSRRALLYKLKRYAIV
jgi:DNA-binding NtrC family response regulator